ncbi:hypothetical protein THRCLA_08942 [Thraustotheca clavata]|uniref:Uncharacterized protein n=1 Tax=Thraustotheca clavata TaxID=74557 RepID=A0A1V9Z0I2_9STRA|nr:hypothetical protein THRCLA_08942 [Thraustotheca clavata]
MQACYYPYPPKNFSGRKKYYRNALCFATLSGDLNAVKRILQCQPHLLSAESIEYALTSQQPEIASFLLNQQFTPCKFRYSDDENERMMQFILSAIRKDNIEIFKMLKIFLNGDYDNVLVTCFPHALKMRSFNCALLLFEWHREQIIFHFDVVRMAAEYGNLDLIIRLHNENARFTTETMDQAAEFGYLSIVKFLHENRTEGCTTEAMDKAAANGHLDVVKFLHVNRTEGCTTDALINSIHNESLELVKYLVYNCPQSYTPDALYMAVIYNYKKLVKLLLDTGKFEFSAKTLEVAYSNDRADFILWFIQTFQDSIAADTLVKKALEDAKFRVVYGLVAAGFPVELPTNMLRCIVHPEALEFFEWFVNQGIELQPQWMDLAASFGTLELVKFFHEKCTAGCTTDAIDGAAKKDKFAIVKFLVKNRSEGCSNAAFEGAIKKKAQVLFELLLKHYPDKCSNLDMAAIFESNCAIFFSEMFELWCCPAASSYPRDNRSSTQRIIRVSTSTMFDFIG